MSAPGRFLQIAADPKGELRGAYKLPSGNEGFPIAAVLCEKMRWVKERISEIKQAADGKDTPVYAALKAQGVDMRNTARDGVYCAAAATEPEDAYLATLVGPIVENERTRLSYAETTHSRAMRMLNVKTKAEAGVDQQANELREFASGFVARAAAKAPMVPRKAVVFATLLFAWTRSVQALANIRTGPMPRTAQNELACALACAAEIAVDVEPWVAHKVLHPPAGGGYDPYEGVPMEEDGGPLRVDPDEAERVFWELVDRRVVWLGFHTTRQPMPPRPSERVMAAFDGLKAKYF